MLAMQELSRICQKKLYAAHRKSVVAGEDQVKCAAIGAHPFCGEMGVFTGTDIPVLGVEGSRPGAPGLWGVVDSEATVKTRGGAREDLHPEIAFRWGVIADRRAAACAGVRENGAALLDVANPTDLIPFDGSEELVGGTVSDAVFGYAG
jgi:hypothetical protein